MMEQMKTEALREWAERALDQDGDDWEPLWEVLDELRRREGWTAPVPVETAWAQFRREAGLPAPSRTEPAALLRFGLRHMRRAAGYSLLVVAGTALLLWAADWLWPMAVFLSAGLAFLALFCRRKDAVMLMMLGISQRQMRQALTAEQLLLCLLGLGLGLGLGLRLPLCGIPGLAALLPCLGGLLLGTLLAAVCMGQPLTLLHGEA